tara:strand:+ start:2235 stop:3356 length:1122 start_codon:yes stop_codon:yes gene_type:complete
MHQKDHKSTQNKNSVATPRLSLGQRVVNRFPSQHEDPEKAAEQERGLRQLVDLLIPQSKTDVALMAAGPVVGRVARSARKVRKYTSGDFDVTETAGGTKKLTSVIKELPRFDLKKSRQVFKDDTHDIVTAVTPTFIQGNKPMRANVTSYIKGSEFGSKKLGDMSMTVSQKSDNVKGKKINYFELSNLKMKIIPDLRPNMSKEEIKSALAKNQMAVGKMMKVLTDTVDDDFVVKGDSYTMDSFNTLMKGFLRKVKEVDFSTDRATIAYDYGDGYTASVSPAIRKLKEASKKGSGAFEKELENIIDDFNNSLFKNQDKLFGDPKFEIVKPGDGVPRIEYNTFTMSTFKKYLAGVMGIPATQFDKFAEDVAKDESS